MNHNTLDGIKVKKYITYYIPKFPKLKHLIQYYVLGRELMQDIEIWENKGVFIIETKIYEKNP